MAGFQASYDRSTLFRPETSAGSPPTLWSGGWLGRRSAKLSATASVLGMFAYFLFLGGVAVVVVTGQIPWFIVPPAVVWLSLAYFRYEDRKYARKAEQQRDSADSEMSSF